MPIRFPNLGGLRIEKSAPDDLGGPENMLPNIDEAIASVQKKRVAICIPHLEMAPVAFMQSLAELLQKGKHEYLLSWGGASYVDVARNRTIEQAREEKPDYYLFIDSDMGFFPQDADKLVDAGLDVISGISFQKFDPYAPTIYRKDESGSYRFVSEWRHGEIIEVDACGAAFMCVSAKAIEAIGNKQRSLTARPWFEWMINSEDIVFCERVKDAGFDIYVHTGVLTDHFTMAPRGREDFIASNKKTREETIHRIEMRV